MQESSLRNIAWDDRDSVGLFQQRPSQGWGSAEQLMDPTYAAGKFYDKLLTISGWQAMPLTQAAQAVQVSALPDAYARWEPDAVTIVQTLTGLIGGLIGPAACHVIQRRRRTQLVHAKPGSGFCTPQRPRPRRRSTSAPPAAPRSTPPPPAPSAACGATPSTCSPASTGLRPRSPCRVVDELPGHQERPPVLGLSGSRAG
jgi:hypothetical protein